MNISFVMKNAPYSTIQHVRDVAYKPSIGEKVVLRDESTNERKCWTVARISYDFDPHQDWVVDFLLMEVE